MTGTTGTSGTDRACERFRSVRSRTEALAAPLGPEDQVVQSMPDCSPTKWHRAHTTWFFEEFVLGPHAGAAPYDPAFRFLFNSYYEAVGPRQPRPRRGMITRPTVDEVAAYRRAVDEGVEALLDKGDPPPEVVDLVELGCHHEEQHQELLLMDAKHLLAQNPLRPAYAAPADAPEGAVAAGDAGAAPVDWVKHPGGIVEVGHGGEGFAYDNEGPRHETLLQPFSLADRLVTEGEWAAFVDDGGYHRPDLWLSDGWYAVQDGGWEAPLYWERADTGPSGWSVFTLGGLRPLSPSAPVRHISYYEADAFARWAGCRLPTEHEWEAVSPDRSAGAGAAWEWTGSAYLPYPGFRPAAGAVGEYNGKFMSGQHVLRGASCATPPGHSRPTYRNFFPPGARWAFSGLRLAS
jgi:ergothioneine biosynthesis protein EgtB